MKIILIIINTIYLLEQKFSPNDVQNAKLPIQIHVHVLRNQTTSHQKKVWETLQQWIE